MYGNDGRINVAPKHMIEKGRAGEICMSKGRSFSLEKIHQVEKSGSGGVVAGHGTWRTESIQMQTLACLNSPIDKLSTG